MTKQEIIAKLESILAAENVKEMLQNARGIQSEYLRTIENAKREQLEDFVESGGIRKEFVFKMDAEDAQIDALNLKIKAIRTAIDQEKNQSESSNLKAKRDLIEKINQLTTTEEHIGKALTNFRELQENWKNIGSVPQDKQRELQNDYSKACENFNYNINIYKQLQEHDLKRNIELKQELINKFKLLLEVTNVKEVERLIKTYRNEWEEIGPVPKENWTALVELYRQTVDLVYLKVRDHYAKVKENQKELVKVKIELCEKAEVIIGEMPVTIKGWNNRTEEFVKIQEAWKAFHLSSREKEDELWKKFRASCDTFFNAKKQFYTKIKEEQEVNKVKKTALAEKAESLKDNVDFEATSNELIKLQKQWQKIGPVAQHVEQKLWTRFRTSCNAFFDSRKKVKEIAEAGLVDNLNKKLELIKEVEAYTVTNNTEVDLLALKNFSNTWVTLGDIPYADRKKKNEEFYKSLENLLDKFSCEEKAKNIERFKFKLDKFKGMPDAESLFKSEGEFIRKKIDELLKANMLFENNMGFLKNAPSLRIDVEQKIEANKKHIDGYKDRLKQINVAQRELTQVNKIVESEIAPALIETSK